MAQNRSDAKATKLLMLAGVHEHWRPKLASIQHVNPRIKSVQ